MTTRTERAISRTVHRLDAALSWPAVNPQRGMPDWVEHWLNWAFQITQRHLDPVDAFREVEIVNSCITRIQRDVASIPRRVYRGRGDRRKELERTGRIPDDGGNLADLLFHANPLRTGRGLVADIVGSLLLSGNAFLAMERKSRRFGEPIELWNMPGHLVRVVPGVGRTIQGYEFQPGKSGTWEPVHKDAVIHFRGYNPEDEPVGLSRLHAVRDEYLGQWYATQWLKTFYQKGGVLSGVWMVDQDYVANKGKPLDDEENAAVVASMRQKHMGWQNAWNPVIINGLKFVQHGMKMNEMEIDKHMAMMDAKVMRALGVPPVVAGVKEGGGLSDAGASTDTDTLYWGGTVSNTCTDIDDVMNERLCPLYGNDVSVESDFSGCLPLQSILLEQAKAHQILTGNKALESVNDARDAMGKAKLPGAEHDEVSEKQTPGFGPDGMPMAPPVDANGNGNGKPAEKKPEPAKAVHSFRAVNNEREALRERHATNLARAEGRMRALVLERLAEQRATAKERLRAQMDVRLSRRARLALDVGALMDEASDEETTRAQRILEDLLRARGIEAMADLEAAAGVALEISIDLRNARVAAFLRTQVERAINVPDETTRLRLRDSLAEGVQAGEGLDDLVRRVDDVFDGRRENALTIARTETQPAYNFASMEAWAQSGVVDHHEWLTSRSGTGGRHAENPHGHYDGLDGQTRALGEPFDVGSARLLYPGDPSGPIGELANCVCVTNALLSQAKLADRKQTIALRHSRNGHTNGQANRILEYFTSGG